MKKLNKKYFIGLSILTVLGASVQAQSPADQSLNNVEGERYIEQVIVSATKRSKDIQDIPIQINAFDESYLQNNRIQEFSDLSTSIPGLVAPDGDAGAGVIAIRGISSPARGCCGIEQPVSVFMNGATAPESLNFLLFDTQQVEVIRGPQGAIWGRNTLAGAISVTTKRPDEALDGYISVSGGDYSFRDYRAAVGGALIDGRLNGRIAFAHDERDGFTKRQQGGTVGNIDRDGVRASLEFIPSDELSITVIGQWDKSEYFNVTPEYFEGAFATLTGTDGFSRTTESDFFEPTESDAYSFTTLVDWELGEYTLSSVTSYRDGDVLVHADSDATRFEIEHEIVATDYDQFVQEFRLARDGAIDGLVDMMLGLNYLTMDSLNDVVVRAEGLIIDITDNNYLDSKAFFGTLDFHLADQLTLNTGFRFANEEKENLSEFSIDSFGLALSTGDRSLDDDQFSYFAGLSYELDDALLYANFGRGHKSGGFNEVRAGGNSFQGEVADTYEIGIKSTWIDDRLVFNASLFFIDYENLQIRTLGGGNTGVRPFVSNAGEAESKGAEIDLIFAITERFELKAAVSYLDAEYKEFLFTESSNNGVVVTDYSGNSLENAPESSANISLDYYRPIGNGELFTFAEASYSDSYFLDFSNIQSSVQKSYTLVNARLGYRINQYEVSLWGRNLTDKDYRVDWNDVFGPSQILGAPRTYGIEFKYSL